MTNSVKTILKKTNELIENKEFIEKYRTSNSQFTRNRKLPFYTIILIILNFMNRTLQIELNTFFASFSNNFTNFVTKQAFSKARQFISPDAFKALFEMTNEIAQKDIRRFKKFRIFAIDGTIVKLEDSKDIRTVYSDFQSSHTPRARVSTITDVLSGIIVHAVMKPCEIGERALAMENLHFFQQFKCSKDIVIFDRGYPSHELISYLEKNKIKYLMRVQKKFNKEIDSTNKKDFLVIIEGNKVRVIKVELNNGEEEVLLTNLSNYFFKHCDFKELYSLRWGIETKYATIKIKMELENFSGKTLISTHQDFYAVLYMVNLVSLLSLESDTLIAEEGREKTWKCQYKTNENCLIGYVKDMFFYFFFYTDDKNRCDLVDILVVKASKSKVAVRNNRHYDRRKGPNRTTSSPKRAT